MVFWLHGAAPDSKASPLWAKKPRTRRTIPRVIVSCLIPVGILYLAMIYCLHRARAQNGLALDQLNAPFDSIARSP